MGGRDTSCPTHGSPHQGDSPPLPTTGPTRRVGGPQDRVLFVGVELAPDRRKTLLGDVDARGRPPGGAPRWPSPTPCRDAPRSRWVAPPRPRRTVASSSRSRPPMRRCSASWRAAEWAWSAGAADGHALGRHARAPAGGTPPGHREPAALRRRPALAAGTRGLRSRSRGSSWMRARHSSRSSPARTACASLLLREVGYAAIGAWRLREMEAPAAASAIVCLPRRSTPTLPVESEERLPLRAAS